MRTVKRTYVLFFGKEIKNKSLFQIELLNFVLLIIKKDKPEITKFGE